MISIVVPIYNGEKYIERCFESIFLQTYSDWEIIAVDDGSSDGSLRMLESYARRDDRIMVLHQSNMGAGEARNHGIEKAKGEYIVFLDVDDSIEPVYLALLSQKTADVVFIDVERLNTDSPKKVPEKMSVYRGTSLENIIRSQMTGKILWGGVRKAVKRQLLMDGNIRFTSHQVGEEAIYSFSILHHAKTIDFIDTLVYKYWVHGDSLSHTDMDDPWGDVAVSLIEKTKHEGVYELYADTLNAFLITAAIVSLNKMACKYCLGKYNAKAREMIARTKQRLDQNFSIDFEHMDMKAKLLYPFFKMNMTGIVYLIARGRYLLR